MNLQKLSRTSFVVNIAIPILFSCMTISSFVITFYCYCISFTSQSSSPLGFRLLLLHFNSKLKSKNLQFTSKNCTHNDLNKHLTLFARSFRINKKLQFFFHLCFACCLSSTWSSFQFPIICDFNNMFFK